MYADEWGIKVGTDSGHIQFGPANNDWAHIYTDRPNFYFNKNIYVANKILSTQEWAQGAADVVNLRIEEEILPAIDSKLGSTDKAADSNLLDGIDSSRFVYGGNSTRTTNISNVSTALNSGFYDGYNITGTPTNTWYTYINMRHNNTSNNYGSQIAVSFYNNADMYVRTISNGTYQGWSKIWNEANFNPTDKASTESVAAAQATADEATNLAREAQATADSKLGATAKAADADHFDGYDSAYYFRARGTLGPSQHAVGSTEDWPNNPAGGTYTTSYVGHGGTVIMSNDVGGSAASIAIEATYYGDMYIHSNTDSNQWLTKRVWTSYNFDPASKANVSHDHNDLYYTKAQSNANYDAAGSASTAQTNAIAAAGDRIDNEVMPIVTDNSTNIARNATEIAAKAAAGGSYGQDFAADDMRVDQWFRNTASGKGLYNEATTQHFYSDDDDYWNVAGGTGANGIRFRDDHAGTIRGYVYADSSNNVGFLDSDGNWGVRVVRDSHVEFRDNNEVTFTVGQGGHSSNYGTVCTHGTGRGNWEGYSINGWWVWMSSDGGDSGIYNDIDNEWATRWYRNGRTELHYNGSVKLQTTNGGVSVTGTVSATAFSGDGSGLTGVPIPDQRVPVTINGEENTKLASINMNLDRGLVEFTMDNGQTFTAQMGR